MIAKVEPAIAQIPAASPSIPSRKLTMFMIATIQSIESGMPTQSGSCWIPSSGNVKRSTWTPKPTAIAAAEIWPPSFPHHGRPRKSSTTPTKVATAAPSRIPR